MKNKVSRLAMPLTKMGLFASMLFVFFATMAYKYYDMVSISQTAVVAVITYIAINLMLFPIYGGYSFGTRDKQVTESCILVVTYIADIVTALQVAVVNASNNMMASVLTLKGIGLLLGAMAIQGILILLFTNLGTSLYIRGRANMKILFISDLQEDSERLKDALCRSLHRESVDLVIDYRAENLKEIMREYETVFVSDVPYAKRQELIENAYRYNLNIFFTPEICDIIGISAEHRMYDDRLVLKSPKAELSFFQRIIKRSWDIVVSLLAIIVFSPAFIICPIIIKLDDGGDVFFRQERATKHGRPFKILKFRTMKPSDETRPAAENDDRITKAGHFLRRTRLDEIPQFFNVLKGDMSVVGPRPEQIKYLHGFDQNYEEYEYRLRVKAGITGHAQIEGRYNTTNKEKLILDLIYIQNYSLWLDLKIVLQTIIVIFKDDSTQGFDGNKKN